LSKTKGVRNSRWQLLQGNYTYSAYGQEGNVITKATAMFSASSCPTEPVAMMYDQTVRNRKWKISDEL
jgi:hypothetical protein